MKMKTFLDSLKHACKVPNTEQPFACVDLVSQTFIHNYLCQNKLQLDSSTDEAKQVQGVIPINSSLFADVSCNTFR